MSLCFVQEKGSALACTLEDGHSGQHVAGGSNGQVYATWPNQSGDGVGASPAATAEPRTPSAQADQDDRTPTPSPLPQGWRDISCTHNDNVWEQVGTWAASEADEPQTIWACRDCGARFLYDVDTGAFTSLTFVVNKTGDGDAGGDPSPSPRTFELVRHHDVSGQTGTGVVAEGVQFTDGSAALRWWGGHPATAVWPNVEEILAVHGHEGLTVLHWLDERTCRVCGCTDESACVGGCYWVAEALCSQCGNGPVV